MAKTNQFTSEWLSLQERKKRAQDNLITPVAKKATPPKRKGRVAHETLLKEINNDATDPFIIGLKILGYPIPVKEHKFHPTRKWRFDYAWINSRVALEVEGGVWMSKHGGKSRHFTGTGAIADMQKYNNAAMLGWRILRVTPEQLNTKATKDMLKEIFNIK